MTAYDEYALRAFEAGALDYLLKPFDDARFDRALYRAKDKLAHYAPLQPRPVERLVVKSRGQVVFLNVADIDWIEAADYYACLHVGDRHARPAADASRSSSGTWAMEKFIRIHRSIIVNLDRIRGLELQSGGEYEVVLEIQGPAAVEPAFSQAASGTHGGDTPGYAGGATLTSWTAISGCPSLEAGSRRRRSFRRAGSICALGPECRTRRGD